MTMTFFFNVTDTGKSKRVPIPFASHRAQSVNQGSWLQIGQSISHFCITSLLLVFSAGIASVGEALMRGSVLRHYDHHLKEGTQKRA